MSNDVEQSRDTFRKPNRRKGRKSGTLPCSKSLNMRLGRLGGWEAVGGRMSDWDNVHFGSPIQAKVPDVEGYNVAKCCM